MKIIKTDIYFLLILVMVIIGFFYPLFFPQPQFIVNQDFGRSDVFHMSISTKYFLWQKIQLNQLPLWSNKIGTGFPLLGEGQIGMFFLPNLILYKIFTFTSAYNLSLIIAIVTFAIGMYLWLRFWKYRPIISFLGTVVFSLSGIIMTHLTHITLLQSLSLMPWVFLSTLLLFRFKKIIYIFFYSLILSQQILAGFIQASLITLLFSTLYFFWLNFGYQQKIKSYLKFVIAILFAFILSAIQILPAQEFLKYSTNPNGFDLSTATYFSYPFKHLITYILPFFLGNPKYGTYPAFTEFSGSIFWENTGYLGILPLLFASYYVFWVKNKNKGLYFFILIILFTSFLLMTGSHSPFYLIYEIWPLNLFRVPSRFIWLFSLALLLLFLEGLENIYQKFKRKKIRNFIFCLIGIFAVWQLFYVWSNYNSFSNAKLWLDKPEITKWIEPDARIFTNGAEMLHNQSFFKTGWTDLTSYLFLKNSLYPNSNLFWEISNFDASVGRFLFSKSIIDAMIKNQLVVQNDTISFGNLTHLLLSLNAVNYIITPYKILPETLFTKITTLENPQQKLILYKNQQALPRIYFAQETIYAKTYNDLLNHLATQKIQLGKQVILNEHLNQNYSFTTGDAKIVSDQETKIEIQVTNHFGNGILVLANTDYPGWQAKIDGKLTKIYQANLNQKAIIIPTGDHKVIFEYYPQSFILGRWISGISHLIILIYGSYALVIFYYKRYSHIQMR